MSSTVRLAISENLPEMRHRQPTVPTYVKPSIPFDSERCSDQRRLFDLRRNLMLFDDKQRLHLDEIQVMMSPSNSRSKEGKGLIPPLEQESVANSS